MSGEFSRDRDSSTLNGSGLGEPTTTVGNGASPTAESPADGMLPTTSGGGMAGGDGAAAYAPPSGLKQSVEDVMYSDIGINTLLNRLKQSIASARDFAQFLKKRSSLEEEQAKGLKRLTQLQLESVKRGEVRGGTYAQQLTEVLRVHERMAENGMQFALSLHQMHEDLDVLSANMERGRKQWKHDGQAAEKNASDAEQAMEKARQRYYQLADDFDRAKTGDSKAGRRIGLKGPKSAEQHENELLRKSQQADNDYEEKVNIAKTQRRNLLNDMRPKAVKNLQELIRECDSALALQLQKFATFNEKLLLGNGLAVSPLGDSGTSFQRSLRELVLDIDNDRDFDQHLSSFRAGTKTRPKDVSDLKYEKHPTFIRDKAPVRLNTQPQPQSQPATQSTTSATPSASQPSFAVVNPLASNPIVSQPTSMNSRYGASPPPQQSFNNGPPSAGGYGQQPGLPMKDPYARDQPPYTPQSAVPRDPYSAAPYATHPSERVVSQGSTGPGSAGIGGAGLGGAGLGGAGLGFGSSAMHQQTTGSIPSSAPAPAPASDTRMGGAPSGKGRVFGLSLDDLFTRDQSAVPIIVHQCIQAVDLFGLEIEGIYRGTGQTQQVTRLREMFDSLPPNAPQLDFRNPANFGHDVNAVTSLLKAFFRELPDPLFTRDTYGQFIESAQVDDDGLRRDALHQCINDLPDANYATLRALVLHLSRVMQNESRTRMTAANLAVCLAPTLMGAHQGPNIADASWQQRAVETILTNATAIFDED